VFDSLDMLAMLVFLLALALVLFSTLIYFCEKGVWEGSDPLDAYGGDPFASIPRAFWWCMAGAYTRLLFSSTRAVSDPQKHPTHPKHPITPP